MAEFLVINPVATRRLAERSAGPTIARKAEMVAARARVLAPGSMKEKIRAVGGAGPSPIGIVVCDHPAALFVLKGTKAHDISAKPGGVLVFTVKGSKTKVFATIVHHKETKANNFLLKALMSI